MSSAGPLAHLSFVDRALFRHFGFGPRREVTLPIIHHAFQKHARNQPHAIAVEALFCNESITYGRLDDQSNRLARRLRERGISPGARVCILARRSIAFVVGILAVLKSGAQYVPLDAVTITDETLQFVLEDSSPSLVLAMEEYICRLSHWSASDIIPLEQSLHNDEVLNLTADPVEDMSSPTDGAYCIYTSGTTGKPKGVDVKHEGVTNVICGYPGNVGMKPGMRVAQLLNIAFDMGAWETLGSLYNGCTLCLRGNTSKEWAALLKTVDIVISTPSILLRHDPENYPNIKHVIVGGEPCPQSLADRWAEYTSFNNCCGPTEISICNTVQPHTSGYPLSIGKPIPNTNVYILSCDSENPEPLPIGQVGCMWVGGIGTNTRYLNLPEKTAERWRKDPFVDGEGMMFNTGDLGRWRKDGQLDHMGRVDDQVKVKGFRVELDGVSAAMRTHSLVTGAVTLLINSELWGFVTPSNVDTTLVRAAVAAIQPYYAVPTQYLAVDDFPMTRNGKVDKKALRSLVESSVETKEVVSSSEECISTPPLSRSTSLSSESEGVLTPPISSSDYPPSSSSPDEHEDEPVWEEPVSVEDLEREDGSLVKPIEKSVLEGSDVLQGEILKKLLVAWV